MNGKQVSQPIRANLPFVRVLLATHGLSQREIAERAGVHKVTVSKVLRNYRRVSADKRVAVLRAIASRCGRGIEELVVGRLAA